MALSYRASAQVFGTTNSTNITIPASVQSGDVLILQAVGGWNPTVPPGWTTEYANFGTNIGSFVAYKTAGAGDAGTNVTVAWSGAFNHVLNLIAIAGSASGVRTPGAHLWASGGGTGTPNSKSAAAGDMVVYLGGNRQDGGPPTLSRGTVDNTASDGSTIAAGVIGHELMATDTLVNCTFTAPSSGAGFEYSVMIVAGAGTPPSYALVETEYMETLVGGTATAQAEAAFAETLVSGSRMAQAEVVFAEVLVAVQPVQVETVYAETLLTSTPPVQIEAVYAESLITTTPPVVVESNYVEVLVIPVAVARYVGWGLQV